MNAEQVVDKILSEANAEADKVRSEAQAQADADQQRLDKELEAWRKETERLATDAAEDRKARMLAAARMENRKAYLAAQVALLDEVFSTAVQRVNALPGAPA